MKAGGSQLPVYISRKLEIGLDLPLALVTINRHVSCLIFLRCDCASC